MRRFATLLSLICLCAIQGFSQEWGTRWICHPQASDTAQVWFRKRVKTTAPQEKAFITVASTGRFRLYVNERNVVTDPFLGAIDSLERHIKQYTIDVSRFLEGRETTIAVWYAPRQSDALTSNSHWNFTAKTREGSLSMRRRTVLGSARKHPPPRSEQGAKPSTLPDTKSYGIPRN